MDETRPTKRVRFQEAARDIDAKGLGCELLYLCRMFPYRHFVSSTRFKFQPEDTTLRAGHLHMDSNTRGNGPMLRQGHFFNEGKR